MDSISLSLTSGSFGLAFGLTLLAGLATGLGAAIAFFAARANQRVLALSLAFSAGVGLYVSIDELLPTAHEYGHRHEVLGGIAAGMALMAVSLLLLR
jgi:ZIP family zinc transporter